MGPNIHPASFRDPSGFIFEKDGQIYRQVNTQYQEQYDQLINSRLHEKLIGADLLLPTQEVVGFQHASPEAYKVLRPEQLTFTSYPYEWCFSQLKDAALTTLRIEPMALQHAMTLKDASAYNIQFHRGRPVLIDTLSFERYQEGEPWTAYRQFCQHFLAPLALMSYRDVRLSQLMRTNIDGIPLDLVSKLLPWRTRLNSGLLFHIHLHAASIRRYGQRQIDRAGAPRQMSMNARKGLIDSLRTTVQKLAWKPEGTQWVDYTTAHYSAEGFQAKQSIVTGWLADIAPGVLWDLGANTGEFSRLAPPGTKIILSLDGDHGSVEKNYRIVKQSEEENILPLVMDLTNPSSNLGWASQERSSLLARGPADCALALALLHHLVISNNLPFKKVAEFLARAGDMLIIEYVPKEDPQAQKLLVSREDIFEAYHQESFENQFRNYFEILERKALPDSQRFLYRMKARR